MPPSHLTSRMYYDDPWRTEFTANVTEIRELSRTSGHLLFQIALDRTAFYPTGGGQPHDTGVLVATAPSGTILEAPVVDVSEDNASEVWHTTPKPLQPGTGIVGRIDAARRRDHMQQHTGQHLLSAIAAREFGAMTIGFHLGKAEITVDLTIPHLPREQMTRLQEQVNETTMQSLPVTQRWIEREEAEALLATGILRKLPPREGDLRIVSIGDIDQNACGGTHVTNTAQIGPIFLRRTEQVRGNTRLAFVCGGRALRVASADWDVLSRVAASLSTSPTLLPERIETLVRAARATRKQEKASRQTATIL